MPKSHSVDIALILSLNSIQHPGLLIMASNNDGVGNDVDPHPDIVHNINKIRERILAHRDRVRSYSDKIDGLLYMATSVDCAAKLYPIISESFIESSTNKKLFNEIKGLHPVIAAMALPLMDIYSQFYEKDYITNIDVVRDRLGFLSNYAAFALSDIKETTIWVHNTPVTSIFADYYIPKSAHNKNYEKYYTNSKIIPELRRYMLYLNNDFDGPADIMAPVIYSKMRKAMNDKKMLLNILMSIKGENVYDFVRWMSDHSDNFGDISMDDIISALTYRYRINPKQAEFLPELLLSLHKEHKINIIEFDGIDTRHAEALKMYPLVDFAWAFLVYQLKYKYDPIIRWLDYYQYKKNNYVIKDMLAIKTKYIMELNMAVDAKELKIKRGTLLNHFSQGFGGLFCQHVK